MVSLLQLIDLILSIYMWVIIAVVVLSWLVAFNIVNRQNDIVRQISMVLYRVTEPVLGRSGGCCRPWAGSICRP